MIIELATFLQWCILDDASDASCMKPPSPLYGFCSGELGSPLSKHSRYFDVELLYVEKSSRREVYL